MITLDFPGMKPAAKARPRVTGRGTYMPLGYRSWKRDFGWRAARQYGIRQPLAGVMAVVILIRTASGNMRPDVDNAAGAVLDALQDAGIIANDGQVRDLRVRVEQAKRAECGISVSITRLPDAPVRPPRRQQGAKPTA